MKTGRTLPDLAAEIKRQNETKRDFFVPMNKIDAYPSNNVLELAFGLGKENYFGGPLTENGHDQLGQICNIPAKYYDLMRSHPKLLAENVRHWLNISSDRRMIRALDGNIRAILSDKYRRLDNFDLAQAVLPMINEADAEVVSCQITDSRLYLKAITWKVEDTVKSKLDVGELVYAGVEIENSEIGKGSLRVNPMAYILSCKNGNIAPKYGLRKYHVGRETEMGQIEFSKDTIKAEDKAFWLKVRDLVKHALSETTFKKITEDMKIATGMIIQIPPIQAIELCAEKYSFTVKEKEDVLSHLIQGGSLTSWGLGNAVTRMAQDVDSYDRSTELESIGFEVMQQNWN